ncbi:uncharacterized protein [Pyrus communis]|uniref:uncharacterized protein isoform X1 n=1 Tax=Pyrus communis TaxID=23211 RepID=UPI0035C12F48
MYRRITRRHQYGIWLAMIGKVVVNKDLLGHSRQMGKNLMTSYKIARKRRCLFASSEQSDVEDISKENAQDFDQVPNKLLKKSHFQLLQKQIPVLPKKIRRGHKGKTGNNNYFIWE